MEKKTYKIPQIELIELDNEISLTLESEPPLGPNESNLTFIEKDHFNINALKTI